MTTYSSCSKSEKKDIESEFDHNEEEPKMSPLKQPHFSTSIADEFELGEEIGKGSYASVYLGVRHKDKQKYALKITHFKGYMYDAQSKSKTLSMRNALKEVRLLSSLKHSHVVLYKEAFFDLEKEQLCLVQEYLNCINLETLIFKRQKLN